MSHVVQAGRPRLIAAKSRRYSLRIECLDPEWIAGRDPRIDPAGPQRADLLVNKNTANRIIWTGIHVRKNENAQILPLGRGRAHISARCRFICPTAGTLRLSSLPDAAISIYNTCCHQ